MMTALSDMLSGLNGGSLIILGIVMGFMQGFDFGGPVGKAALVMGFCGVSEGAIPFAAADPLAVIPASMIGSAVATTMGLLFSITDAIAWGGPIVVVLGLTNHPLLAIICMLTGSIVTALVYYAIKTARTKK